LAITGCNACNNIVDYNVVTQHNNNSRNGSYLVEGYLNPTNVQSGFGLLYSREVNGGI
jgi:hypothetical protein